MKARLHQEELPCKCINKCCICCNSYTNTSKQSIKCINKCSSKCSNSSTNESTKGCHDKCINKWSQCSNIDASTFMGTTFCQNIDRRGRVRKSPFSFPSASLVGQSPKYQSAQNLRTLCDDKILSWNIIELFVIKKFFCGT